jgi:Fungal specific transcription factor domain
VIKTLLADITDISPDTVGIARAFYPLQSIVAFDINPVKAAWMPAATGDEALLNAVLLCSEVHRYGLYTKTGVDYSSRYYQQAIALVNKRLAAGEVCDAVIGAVSCLTLIEVCQ